MLLTNRSGWQTREDGANSSQVFAPLCGACTNPQCKVLYSRICTSEGHPAALRCKVQRSRCKVQRAFRPCSWRKTAPRKYPWLSGRVKGPGPRLPITRASGRPLSNRTASSSNSRSAPVIIVSSSTNTRSRSATTGLRKLGDRSLNVRLQNHDIIVTTSVLGAS